MQICCEQAKARNTKKHDFTYINTLLQKHLTLISVNSLEYDQIVHYYNKLPTGKHQLVRYHIFQHILKDISKHENVILEHLKVSQNFKITLTYIQNLLKTNGCSTPKKADAGTKPKRRRLNKTQQYLLDRQRKEREQCQAIVENTQAIDDTPAATFYENFSDLLAESGIILPKRTIPSSYNIAVSSEESHAFNALYQNSRSIRIFLKLRLILHSIVLHQNSKIIKLSFKLKVAARLCVLDSGEDGIISDFYARHEVTFVNREPQSGVGLPESWIPDPIDYDCSYRALQSLLIPGTRSKQRSLMRRHLYRLKTFVQYCQHPSKLREALDIDEVEQLARHRRRRK